MRTILYSLKFLRGYYWLKAATGGLKEILNIFIYGNSGKWWFFLKKENKRKFSSVKNLGTVLTSIF
jgi:hypothetical protein